MKRTAAGLASLLVLVGGFAAAAYTLVRLAAWPVPSWAAVDAAIQLRYASPRLETQLAACVAWPCLAYLAVSVIRMGAEAWRDRGRQRHGPAAVLQPLVRRAVPLLVVCAGLLNRAPAWSAPATPSAVAAATGGHRVPTGSSAVVTATPARPAPPQPPRRVDATSVAATVTSNAGATSNTNTGETSSPGATAAPTPHRVAPGEDLWVIAQQRYGNALRWRDIWAMNRGHVMVDDHSERAVFDDASLIRPGWLLQMPTGGTTISKPSPAPPPTPPTPPRAPSAAPSATAATASSSAAAVSPSTAASSLSGVPSVSSAGAATTSPPSSVAATPASVPAAAKTTSPSTAASPTNPNAAGARGQADVTAHRGATRGMAPWAAGAGATLLATWAFIEARRRRQRRLRQAPIGAVLPPSDPAVAPVTATVRTAMNTVAVDRLHHALYHLATISDGNLRPVVMLRHPDNRIDVQLYCKAEPVAPWTAADRLFWTLDPAAELPAPDPDVMACPALVQLGVCDDQAELYADLEAMGMLGLRGTPETVRQVARAFSATLVVSPTARLCRVLTYGVDPYGLDEHVEDRFVVASSVESLIHEATMTAAEVADGVKAANAVSSFRLRAVDRDAGWEPTLVVIAGTPLAAAEIEKLERLAGDGGQGAAVVCSADGLRCVWYLELVDPVAGWWQLDPLGLRVRPVQLAAQELTELAAYLADADTEPVKLDAAGDHRVETVEGGGDRDPVPGEAGEPKTTPTTAPMATTPPVGQAPGGPTDAPRYQDPPWLVMVRLFGPPEAVNRKGLVMGDSGRGAPLELLAWLATHRGAATRAGAKNALWDGQEVSPRTLTNALSAARGVLRDLADEPEEGWIGRGDRLDINTAVVSDYDLVVERIRFAKRYRGQYPAAAAQALADGLSLLRGAPLDGALWLWADESHLSSAVAMAGCELASLLAELRLQDGQTDDAIEATSTGLLVIPGNEALIGLGMRACVDGGDRSAAKRMYHNYAAVVSARGESVGPQLAAIRDELLRGGDQ